MNTKILVIKLIAVLLLQTQAWGQHKFKVDANYLRAQEMLSQVDKYYLVPDGTGLYRENFPYDDTYKASYLADVGDADKDAADNTAHRANPYSYLWPFSGGLSAQVALLETSQDRKIKTVIDRHVLKGLAHYFDKRSPVAYASYLNSAPLSDRFYDDNIWLGIDFTDLYLATKDKKYLQEARAIWAFIESGTDDKLGDGIYWVEQNKNSKNTCSNAPGAVYALKLYEATGEKRFLKRGRDLYAWTKEHLMDPTDNLYWDNINLKGSVDKAKYAYNTGQMIQAAVLLYKLTNNKVYLADAQKSAKAAYAYFFDHRASADFPVLKKTDNWFIAVMLRGFVSLYHIDMDRTYIKAFQENLDFAWKNNRDKEGLFAKDWTGKEKADKKWLLDQYAIAEMLARLSNI